MKSHKKGGGKRHNNNRREREHDCGGRGCLSKGCMNGESFSIITQIHKSVLTNDVATLTEICSRNINLVDLLNASVNGFTPLYLACQEGNLEVVRTLLNAGAEIDLPVLPCLSTPLLMTVNKGNYEIFRELVARGADINKHNKEEITPLFMAIKMKNTQIVDDLLNNPRLDLNFHTEETDSFLMYAVRWGDVENVRKLIQKGINLELTDCFGGNSLYIAAQSNELEIVRILLRAGANPNNQDYKKFTPLHAATGHNFIPVCIELLNNGANLDAQNINKITPLHVALQLGHEVLIHEYIRRGAKHIVPDRDLRTH